MTVRVLVADDQHLVRTGFRMILDTEPDIEVIGEATTGREAVAIARELRPDVALMDIRMPDIDGIEATRQIIAHNREPSTRVLMLTTFDLDEYIFDALRAGASGFLLRDEADRLSRRLWSDQSLRGNRSGSLEFRRRTAARRLRRPGRRAEHRGRYARCVYEQPSWCDARC